MLFFIETTAVDLIPLPLAYYTLYLFAFTSLCTLQSSDQSFCWNLQKSTCFCNTVTKSHANIYIYNHSGFTAAGSDQLNVEWIHLWSHAITMNCPFTSPGQMQAFSLKPLGTTLHWIKKKKTLGLSRLWRHEVWTCLKLTDSHKNWPQFQTVSLTEAALNQIKRARKKRISK